MVSYNRIYYFKLSFMKGFHILCLHIFVYSLSKFQLFIFAINYEHVLHNHTFLLHYIYQSACALFQGQIFFPFSILLYSLCLFVLSLVHIFSKETNLTIELKFWQKKERGKMEKQPLEKAKPKYRKGLWSPEEDNKLRNHILKHGHGCWSSVPIKAGETFFIPSDPLFLVSVTYSWSCQIKQHLLVSYSWTCLTYIKWGLGNSSGKVSH